MAGEHLNAQARRVVSGFDEDGRSALVVDEFTPRRVATPAFTVCDIWESETLPIPMDESPAQGEVALIPPKAGLIYRRSTFAPDSEYDSASFNQALGEMGGADTLDGGSSVPGMHVHDTVDIITVVSGEIYIVVETGETLLKEGDTVVLRGAMHAWSNRSDRPCSITSLMMGGLR